MKKQNKFLLTAALVASFVGGYAAQADQAYRDQIDKEIATLNGELTLREQALEKTKANYQTQKGNYSKEVQEIAEKAIEIKEGTIASLKE